jgi:hypothetical protein
MLRWGLILSLAGDPALGVRMIDARAEIEAERTAHRHDFRRAAAPVLLPARLRLAEAVPPPSTITPIPTIGGGDSDAGEHRDQGEGAGFCSTPI